MNTTTGVAARRSVSMLKLVIALAASLVTAAALAAEPIEIIVPFGPGGGADLLARHCVTVLQSAFTAPVQVTNIPGATGRDGIARLLAAPSDGHTVAVLTADTYATLAYENPHWNAADVIPVAIMMQQTSALYVAASSRFAKWQDMEKEARAHPRTLRVAITGLGSPDYIALQQLAATNIQFTPVPLANPQERYQALLSGHADALYEQPGDVRSFVEAGQMRPILIFSHAHSAAASHGVPTSGELGLGNGLPQFRAIVVKAGTDPQVVSALAEAFAHAGESPEFKAFLEMQFASGDSFVAASGARTFMQRELTQMKEVVQGLPMHARFLFDDKEPEVLPAQF